MYVVSFHIVPFPPYKLLLARHIRGENTLFFAIYSQKPDAINTANQPPYLTTIKKTF